MLTTGELQGKDHHSILWSTLRVHWEEYSSLHIVCERFEFRKDERDRAAINYVAAEYVGVVKLFVHQHNVPLIMQQASSTVGRSAFFGDSPEGNAKLRTLGLWSPSVHARDATRHYLYYRTFTLRDNSILYQLGPQYWPASKSE